MKILVVFLICLIVYSMGVSSGYRQAHLTILNESKKLGKFYVDDNIIIVEKVSKYYE